VTILRLFLFGWAVVFSWILPIGISYSQGSEGAPLVGIEKDPRMNGRKAARLFLNSLEGESQVNRLSVTGSYKALQNEGAEVIDEFWRELERYGIKIDKDLRDIWLLNSNQPYLYTPTTPQQLAAAIRYYGEFIKGWMPNLFPQIPWIKSKAWYKKTLPEFERQAKLAREKAIKDAQYDDFLRKRPRLSFRSDTEAYPIFHFVKPVGERGYTPFTDEVVRQVGNDILSADIKSLCFEAKKKGKTPSLTATATRDEMFDRDAEELIPTVTIRIRVEIPGGGPTLESTHTYESQARTEWDVLRESAEWEDEISEGLDQGFSQAFYEEQKKRAKPVEEVALVDPSKASGSDRTYSEKEILALEKVGTIQLGDKIGEGGLGIVRKATAVDGTTAVAVKFAKSQADGVGLRRNFEEVQRYSERFGANDIIPILEVNVDHAPPYSVMPYVEGETLHDRIQRTQGLSQTEVISIFSEILRIVSNIHELQAHGDLKPSNVFLAKAEGNGDRVLLFDFGGEFRPEMVNDRALAPSIIFSGRGEGEQHTSDYLPRGEVPQAGDRSWEYYALGVMLFEMMTGKRPVGGERPSQILETEKRDTDWDGTTLRSMDSLYEDLHAAKAIRISSMVGIQEAWSRVRETSVSSDRVTDDIHTRIDRGETPSSGNKREDRTRGRGRDARRK